MQALPSPRLAASAPIAWGASNLRLPNTPARVTDGVSLFPEGPGGASYLESAIKDAFGKHSGQVIDDLYDFHKPSLNKWGDSESERRLFSFLRSLEFLGRWGDLHLQQKDWADEGTKDFCNQTAFLIQHYSNPKDTQALIAQIAQKNSCRILRNASLASVIAIGIIAAVGLLGCQFILPLSVYISLGTLAFTAVAASQFACYAAQRPCRALWQKLMKDTLSERLCEAFSFEDADTCRALLEPFQREYNLFPHRSGELVPDGKPIVTSLWSCFQNVWAKALRHGDPAVCQAFVAAGAPLNSWFQPLRIKPLEIVIYKKNSGLCKILLAAGAGQIAGASPNQPTTLDPSFWWKALQNLQKASLWNTPNALDICQVFIDSGLVDVNAANGAGDTPLDYAIEKGISGLCKLLLAAGAGRIPSSDQEQPPTLDLSFWWKAQQRAGWREYPNALAICQVFIDSGLVDVNAADNKGYTPLDLALILGKKALCTLLLAAGAGRIPGPDPEQPLILDPAIWWKALQRASWREDPNYLAMCQFLIDSGLVDVNAPHQNGRSPLHEALFTTGAHTELCKILLAAGADMNALAPAGITRQYPTNADGARAPGVSTARPLWQEALLLGQDDNCRALAAAAKNPNIKLILAAYCGDNQHFAAALSTGADTDFMEQCLQDPAFAYAKNVIEKFLKQVDVKALKTVLDTFTAAAGILPKDIARLVFSYAICPVLKETPKPAKE